MGGPAAAAQNRRMNAVKSNHPKDMLGGPGPKMGEPQNNNNFCTESLLRSLYPVFILLNSYFFY